MRLRAVQLPTWFLNLSREMHALADKIVNSSTMRDVIDELKQVRRHHAPTARQAPRVACPCRAHAVHVPCMRSPCIRARIVPCMCTSTQTSHACAQVHPNKAQKVSSALHYCLAQFEYKFLDAALEYCMSVGLDARVDSLDGYLWLAGSFPAHAAIAQVVLTMRACACGRILTHSPCHNHSNAAPIYTHPLARVADASGVCRRDGVRASQHRHPDDDPAVPPSRLQKFARHLMYIRGPTPPL